MTAIKIINFFARDFFSITPTCILTFKNLFYANNTIKSKKSNSTSFRSIGEKMTWKNL
jgi:hypothetical protein